MIQQGTVLNVCDKTGVISVRCVKILGLANKRTASYGDIVLVSIIRINNKKMIGDGLKKLRFAKGTLHRGLIVRTKTKFFRDSGSSLYFDDSAVVLINESFIPLSNRLFGPIMKELCVKYLPLGSIAKYIY